MREDKKKKVRRWEDERSEVGGQRSEAVGKERNIFLPTALSEVYHVKHDLDFV